MPHIRNYLRSHRIRSGFSKREMADIVGVIGEIQVGRHERSTAIPSLQVALAYQALFKVSIADLFPGLHEAIALSIEEHLAALESRLHDRREGGRAANEIARKLVWLTERRSLTIADPTK